LSPNVVADAPVGVQYFNRYWSSKTWWLDACIVRKLKWILLLFILVT